MMQDARNRSHILWWEFPVFSKLANIYLQNGWLCVQYETGPLCCPSSCRASYSHFWCVHRRFESNFLIPFSAAALWCGLGYFYIHAGWEYCPGPAFLGFAAIWTHGTLWRYNPAILWFRGSLYFISKPSLRRIGRYTMVPDSHSIPNSQEIKG